MDDDSVQGSLEVLMLRTQRTATLRQALVYYGVQLEKCASGNRFHARCPLPSHPKTRESGRAKGKTFIVFCDDHDEPYSWKCFSTHCNHNMAGRGVITFVALMEGISQWNAAKKICGGFLSRASSLPSPELRPVFAS
jgi:hypothetical protein